MEGPFDALEGVESTTVGYTGGHKKDPTYEEVSSGETGHTEAVQVIYDPTKVSYEKLLDVFWRNIDPTTVDQQFADVGSQYRTGIFYLNEEQRKLAESSKKKLVDSKKFNKLIVTEISPASHFYPAEDYHQGYYEKNPQHYKMYRTGSGRENYINKNWPKDK